MRREKTEQRRQALAIALASGMTYQAAAAQIGICVATAFKWAREPGFRETVKAFQDRLTDHALEGLIQAQGQAVATLVALMSTGKADNVRLKAAVEILHLAARLREERELRVQIEALEAQVRALDQ